jgi:hypothetical protein
MNNPKCTHNMPHPCDECSYFYSDYEDSSCRPICHNDSNEGYTPSSTAGDYSPGNPWDAPGMSIHDFI